MKNKRFGKCLYWGGGSLCVIGGFAVLLSLFATIFAHPGPTGPGYVIALVGGTALIIIGGLLVCIGNRSKE